MYNEGKYAKNLPSFKNTLIHSTYAIFGLAGKFLKNDFEESIFIKYLEIKKEKEKMYERGAVYASMTGSGSTVYGIFSIS